MTKKARRRRMIEAMIETVIYTVIGMGMIVLLLYFMAGVLNLLGL